MNMMHEYTIILVIRHGRGEEQKPTTIQGAAAAACSHQDISMCVAYNCMLKIASAEMVCMHAWTFHYK